MRQITLLIITLLFLIGCQKSSQFESESSYANKNISSLNKLPEDYSAHWLTAKLILLPANDEQNTYVLNIPQEDKVLSVPLHSITTPIWVEQKYPHLKKFQAFEITYSPTLSELEQELQIKQWLKQTLFVTTIDNKNTPVHIAYIQTSALIDTIYTSRNSDANEVTDLGASVLKDNVQFKLWAPTALQVDVLLFNQDKSPASPAKISMLEDPISGVWYTTTDVSHAEDYYQYQIEIYHPASKKVETLITTDPYSLSLSTNSKYSHIIDLNSDKTQPSEWNKQGDVLVNNPEDNIFYETHIRDFSAHETQLSNQTFRGKYKAFAEKDSAGIQHLKTLNKAGVNSIHLLPSFDIGTVNELQTQVIDLNDPVSKVCKLKSIKSLCEQKYDQTKSIRSYLNQLSNNDESRQEIISSISSTDNYNWGYDPFHYTVPEGSYAINPEGAARIIEFREMIQSLHNLGFRVIMDVVYNHTHQAGLAPTAVLDKIVPNYYHRLDPITGEIAQSTCCDNTATEHVMMEKLMIDSLIVWAKDYKIDGFRFDLMAHQPKSAMLKARKAVQQVDPDTYFYGEGWNFGEVANNQRFVQASQLELGGSEIGTFTDRLRDAVRGGAFNAVGKGNRKSQGIGNGLGTIPNDLQNTDLTQYYLMMDQLRVGLAANLANYPLINAQGNNVTGKDIPYGDQPTGYALDPADTINYVSKHDNQTLWDNNQYRIAYNLSTSDRVRMQLQSLAFPIFAQGIPFLHMGSELLRSKSFLRDSYDYGDWFNRVDFNKQTNNYNVGLPPRDKDEANWEMIKELIEKNEGRDIVSPEDIEFSSRVFMELISLRMSSPLFRLTTEKEIIKRVKFHNTGKEQQLGLIVMSIDDSEKLTQLDDNISKLVVVFNTSANNINVAFDDALGFKLHSIQQQSRDSIVKQSKILKQGFMVPALTTAIFIRPR